MVPWYLNPFTVLKNMFNKIRDWLRRPVEEDPVDEKVMILTPYVRRWDGRQTIKDD